jgi:hypothetical protein
MHMRFAQRWATATNPLNPRHRTWTLWRPLDLLNLILASVDYATYHVDVALKAGI